ncbi:MAG: SGNH/GDSL hydrolase family protein [Clostridiales bacterium]|nr:SGNH/GDSL hydrolase family protein [Clostridiales bacterium]
MRILFLGNSFTFFHDLPEMVAELLNAEVKGNLRGGAYLHQHIDPSDELCAVTRKLLTEERWDYVVLQDQSQGPITHPMEFTRAVAALSQMIRAAGATPVLYETWAYEEGSDTLASTGMTFFEMQKKLSAGYHTAAEANQTLLAPVGQVFAASRKTIQLYDVGDHYHPSSAGSQLAAETIAATIQMDQAR